MINKSTKIFAVFIVILLAVVWLNFWRLLPKHSFVIDDTPLITLNYVSIENSIEGKLSEKTEKLRLAGRIFSIDESNIKKAKIISGDSNYYQFADYNITIGNDREQFFSIATIVDVGADPNNFISSILEDKNNQKYATVFPNQVYDIYLQFEKDSSSIPTSVIINQIKYPILSVGNNFYKVSNFQSKDMTSVGLKTENGQYKVKEAVFITGKINLKTSLNRVLSNDDTSLITLDGNNLNIDVGEKSFVLLSSEQGAYLENNDLAVSQPTLVNTNDYSNEYAGISPKINFSNVKTFNLVSSSANYLVKDELVEKRVTEYIIVSLALLLIFILFHKWQTMLNLGRNISTIFGQNYFKLKCFVQSKRDELSVIAGIMLFTLILRANPKGAEIFTATNLLIILFLMLLIFFRFSIRYLAPILLLSITVEALIVQLNLSNITEKTGKMVLAEIFIIFLVILFSKDKPIRAKKHDKIKIKN